MLCFLREGRDIVRLESLPRLRVYRLLGIKKTGSIHTLSGIKKQKLVPTGAFRPLTGSSSALRGRFCDSAFLLSYHMEPLRSADL